MQWLFQALQATAASRPPVRRSNPAAVSGPGHGLGQRVVL